ncbi:MAG: heparinase II/III family protein [Chloroflexota bacterium]
MMSTLHRNDLPNRREIRAAILAATPRPSGFPLQALRDPAIVHKLRIASHLQSFLSEMRVEAQRAVLMPLDSLSFGLFRLFETTGERVEFENVYFDRRRRLLALALATVVDETDEYLVALSNVIWEVCNEYTWSLPAHLQVGIESIKAYRVPPEQVVDLFAAQTAHTLAEILSLLDGKLDPWLHYRIRTEIERRIFQPIFYDPRQFEWESAPMNWAAVCSGCVGMAALILENDSERLVGMLDRVMGTMGCFLEGFGEDGGCPEGISYWVYGFGFFTYFADMLRSFTDGQLDLLQSEHVQRIAAFPQVVSLGQGRYINYSDALEHVTIHPGLGSYLMSRLQQTIPDLAAPNFHGDHIYRWEHVTRDLLWTEPTLLGQLPIDNSFYLSDLGWVVHRRTLDAMSVVFSAKGGHNDEPHNHNDLGHFILHVGGESLLADLGPGIYTRQYFGTERYTLLQTGSQGHSVPLINGHTQATGSTHAAKVLRYETHSDALTFVLDLTAAYTETTLKSFVRSFDWSVDPSQGFATLKLIDNFSFDEPSAMVEECFISLVLPAIGDGLVSWRGELGQVAMRFAAEQYAAALETIETQMHLSEPLTVYRLRLRARQAVTSRSDTFVFVCCHQVEA